MKPAVRLYCSVILSTLFCLNVTAQKTNTCIDPAVKGKAENIKKTYADQGLVVFQESMLSMTSMEPTPIAIRMQQGIKYEMIFVGNEAANRIMLEIFDGSDKKLDQKVEKDASHLLYTFTPKKTEVYLVTLTQKKGVKDMCGYFGMMVKKPAQTIKKSAPVRTTQPATYKPAPKNTAATPVKKTTTTTNKTTTTPNNQQPNPNRTRATQEHRQTQQK